MFNKKNKKGFTLIELIVVMAIIGILVLLAIPKFMGHTKEAKLTKFIHDTKQLETASERYYMDKGEWPRLSDTPYSAEQVKAFAQKVYDATGKEVTLDTNGSYYDIDYDKLQKYIKVNDSKEHYILQNPVGNIYALEGLTEEAKNRFLDYQPIPDIPEPAQKVNTNVDISKYSQILYVDSNLGVDEVGNGSEIKPFKSITYAIDNITIDNTAILIASGNYEETLKHVPGSYEGREHALVRSSINKNYDLIGDRVNPPVITLYTIYDYGCIVQGKSSALSSEHTYGLYNLIFKMKADSKSLYSVFSDLSSQYKVTINVNNVVVDNSNSKIYRIAYFNGGQYGTLSNGLTLNINNSVMQASNILYSNGNGTINTTNSIMYTSSYGANALGGPPTLNVNNSIFYPYKYNTTGVYQENPQLDLKYEIQNINQQNLNIGVYSGQYAWIK